MKSVTYSLISIFLILILFLSGLYLLIFKNPKAIITTKITKKTSYQVYLLPNSFYDENPLISKLYASNSIEYINLTFNYKLLSKKQLPPNYKSKITTEIIANLKSDNTKDIIWSKTFTTDEEQKEITNNEINLTKSINIDYNFYNNLVKEYETTYNLQLDALLKVKLNFILENFTDDIEVNIPLNSKTTSINESFKPTTINKEIPHNYFKYFGLTLIFTSFILLSSKLKRKLNFPNYRLKHILKEYQELIIPIKEYPPLNNFSKIHPRTLEDLIDVALTNHTHIIFYQNTLYCLINNYAYIYNLPRNCNEIK